MTRADAPELTLSSMAFSCQEVRVKNTFIEVDEDGTPLVSRHNLRRFNTQPEGHLTTEDEASDAERKGAESPDEGGEEREEEEEEALGLAEATDGQLDGRHYTPVPQFQGGGPAVLVKNTFIDVDLKTPSARRESRFKTAPDSRAVGAAIAGFSTDEELGEDYNCEDEAPSFQSEEGSADSCNENSVSSQGGESPLNRITDPKSVGGEEVAEVEEEVAEAPTAEKQDGLLTEQAKWQDGIKRREEWRWAQAVLPVVQMRPLMLLTVGVPPSSPGLMPKVPQSAGPAAATRAMAPSAPADCAKALVATKGGQGAAGLAIQQMPPCILQSVALRSNDSGFYRVQWNVDAKKLRGNDKQAVSPPFELALGASSRGSVPFKMMIYPKAANDSRAGASFKKSGGKGYVQLKCDAEDWQSVTEVSFRITIGDGKGVLAPRGPFPHNFLSSAVCGLPREQEIWDFSSAIDPSTMMFCICLEIAPANGTS